jgi:hypothetical protein
MMRYFLTPPFPQMRQRQIQKCTFGTTTRNVLASRKFIKYSSSIPDQVRSVHVVWDLWWTECHWGRFCSSTSISPTNFHSTNCSIFANHSIIEAIISILTASLHNKHHQSGLQYADISLTLRCGVSDIRSFKSRITHISTRRSGYETWGYHGDECWDRGLLVCNASSLVDKYRLSGGGCCFHLQDRVLARRCSQQVPPNRWPLSMKLHIATCKNNDLRTDISIYFCRILAKNKYTFHSWYSTS